MRLVFVHGFLGSAINWSPVLHKLKARPELAGWTFDAYDLLGHGQRLREDLPLTLDSIAQDLRAQIGEESGGETIALGHSFGVRPLLKISESEPGFFRHLIVEDSSPVLSEGGFRDLRKIFDIPVPFPTREAARDALDEAFGAGSRMSRFLLSNIRERGGVQTWRFDLRLEDLLEASTQEALWSTWEAFPGRIEMILGGRSSFVSEPRIEECVSRRPGKVTHVHKVPGTGHWVHSDDPEAFVSLLVQILVSLSNQTT